ncbi:MAG: 2-oxoglutarate dehydrogenase E1 component [Geminicoccaceae bacterium]|nr:2-oxoglutarate dehydrogenase E1 component [Geminicoccaceae bacterium]
MDLADRPPPASPASPRPRGGRLDLLGAGDPGALEALLGRLLEARAAAAVGTLEDAYRRLGHRAARLDPLGLEPVEGPPELRPEHWGLDPTLVAQRVAELERIWCGPIGFELDPVREPEPRAFLVDAAERAEEPDTATARAILEELAATRLLEETLLRRLPGQRLFLVAGAEAFLLLIRTVLEAAVEEGVEEVVIGGMHRGRLATLVRIAGKPLSFVLAELAGASPFPPGVEGAADVPYHVGWQAERTVAGRPLRLALLPHPSHLELVQPVALGEARARQRLLGPDGRGRVLPLLLHSEASFSGQGIVAETFQLARLPDFEVGGAIRLVLDNRVGFTTEPERARSSLRPTDLAAAAGIPVLHVAADEPEAVWRAGRIAARFRARFARDIVIRLLAYRRYGHNELDEPRTTRPLVQARIDAQPPVDRLYRARLEARGLDLARLDSALEAYARELDAAFAEARSARPTPPDPAYRGRWAGLRPARPEDFLEPIETGVALDRLRDLGRAITTPPLGFALHPKIAKFLAERRAAIEAGGPLDWAGAEALALATLLAEGRSVRLCGQDSVRGAFAQRHLRLVDQASGREHRVLAPVAEATGARLELVDTPLIEHAVLAFEYGGSRVDPQSLVIWEAQFGDFLNIAQPSFDQMIACGEDRWRLPSGLVLLLPHGLDGGGPDHATARPERLLAACAGANLVVLQPSTPANVFHALRRTVALRSRVPTAILVPKALLRHPRAQSPLAELGPGTGFHPVIAAPEAPDAARVLIASGKLAVLLEAAIAERGLVGRIALVRLEQLHPFPEAALAGALAPFARAELVAVEEEPLNQGWIRALLPELVGAAGRAPRRIGRPASPTPAEGPKSLHEARLRAVLEEALAL